MNKNTFVNEKKLTMKELEEVCGGHGFGLFTPLMPGFPRHPRFDPPEEIKDKPKDGGATGGW